MMEQTRSPRILIADEDVVVCAVLRGICAPWNPWIRQLTTPLWVVEVVQQPYYDIIMLDPDLPSPLGLARLATLHALCPCATIIVLSPTDDRGLIRQALQSGAFDVVHKPVVPAVLGHVVQRALDLQPLEAELPPALAELAYCQAQLQQLATKVTTLTHELLTTKDLLVSLAQDIEHSRHHAETHMGAQLYAFIGPLIEALGQQAQTPLYELPVALLVKHMEQLYSEDSPPGAATARLSTQEVRIVALLTAGLTTEVIATKLHIAPATVKTHRRNIRKKLGLRGTTQKLRPYLQAFTPKASSTAQRLQALSM
jgi:DNA-binding NarL/FixJ family response regulator